MKGQLGGYETIFKGHSFHFIFIQFREGGPSVSAGFQGALHLLYNLLYNTIKNKAKAYHELNIPEYISY